MKKAAIIIEKWKLEIFERHLKDAGYAYEILPGLSDNLLTIQAKYEWVAEIKPIIEVAQAECHKVMNGKSV